VELNAQLRPKTVAKNLHKLRTQMQLKRGGGKLAGLSSKMLSFDLSDGAPSVAEQLQQVLRDNFLRILDVFRMWDIDEDGTVSRKEFAEAIGALGYAAERTDIDAVFDHFDSDQSGMLDYHEMYAQLRAGKKHPKAPRISRPPDDAAPAAAIAREAATEAAEPAADAAEPAGDDAGAEPAAAPAADDEADEEAAAEEAVDEEAAAEEAGTEETFAAEEE